MGAFDKNIADGIFSMLVSGSKENIEIARLQRASYPHEYNSAIGDIRQINIEICERVQKLVADTLFEKSQQNFKNGSYKKIFAQQTTMFQVEVASHEAWRNLPLMFFYCIPTCDMASFFKNDAKYTGGRYVNAGYYSTIHVPKWVVKKYNVFKMLDAQERIDTLRTLHDFKNKLAKIISEASATCPEYTLLRDIAQRLKK